MSQLEHIEAIETRLWSAADNLRGILKTHKHGLITTTNDFCSRAVKEAVQPDKPPSPRWMGNSS